jgi:hypothetical protein
MTRCTVSGEIPANPDDAPVPNSATRSDGQHVDHWTMCPGEIIKQGFKRPVRLKYQHVGIPGPTYPLQDLTAEQRERYDDYVKYEPYPKGTHGSALGRYWTQLQLDAIGKGCGTVTSMPRQIAETYAANPGYYGSTFCCGCSKYLPVGAKGEFVWDGTNDRVGT